VSNAAIQECESPITPELVAPSAGSSGAISLSLKDIISNSYDGRLQLNLDAGRPVEAIDAAKDAARMEIQVALHQARTAFKDHPAYLKIGKLQAALREAEKLLAEAKAKVQEARHLARVKLANADDPAAHEANERAGQLDVDIYIRRCEQLREFVEKARAEAKLAIADVIWARHGELELAAKRNFEEVAGKLLAALPLSLLIELAQRHFAMNFTGDPKASLDDKLFELPDEKGAK
jgi:hypothetical protein